MVKSPRARHSNTTADKKKKKKKKVTDAFTQHFLYGIIPNGVIHLQLDNITSVLFIKPREGY